MDELAERLGLDRLEFRHRNALGAGDATPPGRCSTASRRARRSASTRCGRTGGAARDAAAAFNAGVATCGAAASASAACGTASATPRWPTRRPCASRWRATARSRSTTARSTSARARPRSWSQIAADALGLPVGAFGLVVGDTDLTPDAGKTSASRQTFVSGNAARLAGEDLRRADPAARQRRRGGAAGAATAPAAAASARASVRREIDLRRAGAEAATATCSQASATLGSADHAARRRRPGRALRDLRLRRADRRGRGRHRSSAPCKVLHDRRRARRRPRHQPDAGRGPDPRRHRAGARPGADGGVHARPHREPARLPDPDRRRHAARSRSS